MKVFTDEELTEIAVELWGATTDPHSGDAGIADDFTEAIQILRDLIAEAQE